MLVESCRDQLWGNGIPLRDKDSLNREVEWPRYPGRNRHGNPRGTN